MKPLPTEVALARSRIRHTGLSSQEPDFHRAVEDEKILVRYLDSLRTEIERLEQAIRDMPESGLQKLKDAVE